MLLEPSWRGILRPRLVASWTRHVDIENGLEKDKCGVKRWRWPAIFELQLSWSWTSGPLRSRGKVRTRTKRSNSTFLRFTDRIMLCRAELFHQCIAKGLDENIWWNSGWWIPISWPIRKKGSCTCTMQNRVFLRFSLRAELLIPIPPLGSQANAIVVPLSWHWYSLPPCCLRILTYPGLEHPQAHSKILWSVAAWFFVIYV